MDDRTRLIDNIQWFNQFFNDVYRLFHRIATALLKELALPQSGYYYPRPNNLPQIPPYYVVGIGGDDAFAVQVFLVLDVTLLENQPTFMPEMSFIVVKHPVGKHYLRLDGYGMRIIRNQVEQISVTQSAAVGTIVSGRIAEGGRKGTSFQAFQVPIEAFVAGQDIDAVIQLQMVEVLKKLPDL
jgi:hypothetical protein